MELQRHIYLIASMSQKMDLIQLDSQKIAIVSQVYSSLFREQQGNKKKKGEKILEQRSNENPMDKTQHKLIKILEQLKSSILPSLDKRRVMEQRLCQILKHIMNRDEDIAKKLIQQLQGNIKGTMHVFTNCYFYQTIPLEHKYNPPLESYFEAIIKPQITIDQIQQKFSHLPQTQSDFFYALHCEIVRLKQQYNKFQKWKIGKDQKQIINLAKAESILGEINQMNKAIQEKDNLLVKMDKIKNILSEMSHLQDNMANQQRYGTLTKSIEESAQEFRLSLRKIYSSILDLSKKWSQKQGQAPSKTLLGEMKNQNISLKRQKQDLDSQNQFMKNLIRELEDQISSRSHQISEKPSSRKEEEMRLKIKKLEQSQSILKKQIKHYQEKLQQDKNLSIKVNELNLRIKEKQETYKINSENTVQNLHIARQSLKILSEEKQQQTQEYSKLQQKNAQLSQEMAGLRNQIIVLKQQIAARLSQPIPSDSSNQEIIKNLRVNQKNQKKSYDKLDKLYQQQRNQRQEVDLEASKLRQSYQSSQNDIQKLQAQVEVYKISLQQKQVASMENPVFDEMNIYRTHEQYERKKASSQENLQDIVGQKKVLLDESKLRNAKYQQGVDGLQIKLSQGFQEFPNVG